MFGFGSVELLSTHDAQKFYSICYALKGSSIKHTTDVAKDDTGSVNYKISVKKKDYDKAKAVADRMSR